MRFVVYTLSAVLLLVLTGCAAGARTPWGNLDLKGGSGSDCSPVVAPESRSPKQDRRPAIVRPVAPVAPLAPLACLT